MPFQFQKIENFEELLPWAQTELKVLKIRIDVLLQLEQKEKKLIEEKRKLEENVEEKEKMIAEKDALLAEKEKQLNATLDEIQKLKESMMSMSGTRFNSTANCSTSTMYFSTYFSPIAAPSAGSNCTDKIAQSMVLTPPGNSKAEETLIPSTSCASFAPAIDGLEDLEDTTVPENKPKKLTKEEEIAAARSKGHLELQSYMNVDLRIALLRLGYKYKQDLHFREDEQKGEFECNFCGTWHEVPKTRQRGKEGFSLSLFVEHYSEHIQAEIDKKKEEQAKREGKLYKKRGPSKIYTMKAKEVRQEAARLERIEVGKGKLYFRLFVVHKLRLSYFEKYRRDMPDKVMREIEVADTEGDIETRNIKVRCATPGCGQDVNIIPATNGNYRFHEYFAHYPGNCKNKNYTV